MRIGGEVCVVGIEGSFDGSHGMFQDLSCEYLLLLYSCCIS